MYRMRMAAAAVVLTAALAAHGAEGPAAGALTPAANAAAALSPAVQAALKDLSAEDYKTRQAALANLELAFGEQMRALVASDDPEVQARMAELLQFNDGLSRWALDTLKLPAEQRQAQLDFGLQPEVLPALASVFSADVDKRVEGVKALGKLHSDEATVILARLLDDPERAVYVAAMEAVWDRKPTDAVVDSLWNRAVESGFGRGRQLQAVPQNVVFRGRALNGGFAYMGNNYQQDAGIACDVLVNLKAPQVNEKLKAFVTTLVRTAETNPWAMNGAMEQMKNVYRLVEVYKSKEAIAALYQIATSEVRQRVPGQMNGEKYYWSNRTGALATVIEATDQKVEDYQLKRLAPLGGMWTVPAEEDENNAVKKLQEWMAANGQKYGIKAVVEPATQPAPEGAGKAPAPANAAGVIVAPGVIQVQPLIQGGIQIQVGPAPDAK